MKFEFRKPYPRIYKFSFSIWRLYFYLLSDFAKSNYRFGKIMFGVTIHHN